MLWALAFMLSVAFFAYLQSPFWIYNFFLLVFFGLIQAPRAFFWLWLSIFIFGFPKTRRFFLKIFMKKFPVQSQSSNLKTSPDYFSRELNKEIKRHQGDYRLTEEESAFIRHQISHLCGLIHENSPPGEEFWHDVKKERILGLAWPKDLGGLGFSSLAWSDMLTHIFSRNLEAGHSIAQWGEGACGPLIVRWGSPSQKSLLKKMARGELLTWILKGVVKSHKKIFRGKNFYKISWSPQKIPKNVDILGLWVPLEDDLKAFFLISIDLPGIFWNSHECGGINVLLDEEKILGQSSNPENLPWKDIERFCFLQEYGLIKTARDCGLAQTLIRKISTEPCKHSLKDLVIGSYILDSIRLDQAFLATRSPENVTYLSNNQNNFWLKLIHKKIQNSYNSLSMPFYEEARPMNSHEIWFQHPSQKIFEALEKKDEFSLEKEISQWTLSTLRHLTGSIFGIFYSKKTILHLVNYLQTLENITFFLLDICWPMKKNSKMEKNFTELHSWSLALRAAYGRFLAEGEHKEHEMILREVFLYGFQRMYDALGELFFHFPLFPQSVLKNSLVPSQKDLLTSKLILPTPLRDDLLNRSSFVSKNPTDPLRKAENQLSILKFLEHIEKTIQKATEKGLIPPGDSQKSCHALHKLGFLSSHDLDLFLKYSHQNAA